MWDIYLKDLAVICGFEIEEKIENDTEIFGPRRIGKW